jgi:hypothetical protein
MFGIRRNLIYLHRRNRDSWCLLRARWLGDAQWANELRVSAGHTSDQPTEAGPDRITGSDAVAEPVSVADAKTEPVSEAEPVSIAHAEGKPDAEGKPVSQAEPVTVTDGVSLRATEYRTKSRGWTSSSAFRSIGEDLQDPSRSVLSREMFSSHQGESP